MLARIPTEHSSEPAAHRLMQLISQGELQPEQRLPAKPDLAGKLGVTRPAVREALRVLENLGYVEFRPGQGTFVRGRVPPVAWLSERWREWVRTYRKDLMDLYQVRHALESQAAALAAQRATRVEIAALRDCLWRMEQAVIRQNVDEMAGCDIEFHGMISAISRNQFLQRLLADLAGILDENRRLILSLEYRRALSLREHRIILLAVARHDPGGAVRAMANHLVGILALVEDMSRP